MASLSSSSNINVDDVSKMKVAELKKELKSRGLSTSGTKAELVERLQTAHALPCQDAMSEDDPSESHILDDEDLGDLEGVEAGGDFDDDDDAVLADEPKEVEMKQELPAAPPLKRPLSATEPSQESQPKKRVLVRPISISSSTGKENGSQENKTSTDDESKTVSNEATEKKVVKLSGVPAKERLQLRAQKFGTPLSEDAKKQARAERFGTSTPTPASAPTIAISASAPTTEVSAAAPPKTSTHGKITFGTPDPEVLKKRAARFGANVSTLAQKVEEDEKKKKRLERFGLTAASAETVDEKKKLRAERFKV